MWKIKYIYTTSTLSKKLYGVNIDVSLRGYSTWHWFNNKLHNRYSPAVIIKEPNHILLRYYINDKKHKVDGPADIALYWRGPFSCDLISLISNVDWRSKHRRYILWMNNIHTYRQFKPFKLYEDITYVYYKNNINTKDKSVNKSYCVLV